jgi:hypothetical protein
MSMGRRPGVDVVVSIPLPPPIVALREEPQRHPECSHPTRVFIIKVRNKE